MRQSHITVWLLGLLLSLPLQADESVRFAFTGQHPPFSLLNGDGRMTGFDADLVRALCDQAAVNCVLEAANEAELLTGLRDGRHDAVIATALTGLQGQDGVLYGRPYHSAHVRFIASAGDDFDPAVAGVRLAALVGSPADDYLQRHYATSARLRQFEQREAMYNALAEGQLDGLLDDAQIGFNWLVKPGHTGHDFAGDVIDVNLHSAIIFAADQSELRERLDQALDVLRQRGIYQRISGNYFPFKTF